MKYDICNNNNIIDDFCKFNSIEYCDSYDTIFNIFFSKTDINMPSVDTTYKKQSISFDKININKVISVSYLPYSQKYIDYYHEQKIFGTVMYIDHNKEDGLLCYMDSMNEINICSICRDYCSYYGTTSGYAIQPYLLFNSSIDILHQ